MYRLTIFFINYKNKLLRNNKKYKIFQFTYLYIFIYQFKGKTSFDSKMIHIL